MMYALVINNLVYKKKIIDVLKYDYIDLIQS